MCIPLYNTDLYIVR